MSKTSAMDAWEEKDQRIEVIEGDSISLRLRAKVDAKPSTVYEILTDPKSINVWRNIKECTFWKLLEEDRVKGTRKIEVAHKAVARLLFISVTFETRLHVWEDDLNRKIRFCNAQEGFMKKFEGSWHIQPFSERTLMTIANPAPPPSLQLPGPLAALQTKWLNRNGTSTQTLATLEQSLVPRSKAPPGIKGLIRRLCAKQLRDMMEDLRAEVERREGRAPAGGTSMRGKDGSHNKHPSAASAASMTSSMVSKPDLWDHVSPLINIVIKL